MANLLAPKPNWPRGHDPRGRMTDPRTPTKARWLTPGVRGIGADSFLADVGHEIPTALLPNLLTATLGAPAAALGLIEGLSDGLAGAARLAGGGHRRRPHRRRTVAVGGYTTAGVKVEAGGWREPADRRAIRWVGWSG
jgi:hypothetical protein